MRITITPTPTITLLGGTKLRLWEGVTDRGVRCHVYVRAVAVADGADNAAFERELLSMPPPDEALTPLARISPAKDPGAY